MKTINELAKKLGISPQRLQYWANRPDAPKPKYKLIKKRMTRIYDEDVLISYWKMKNARYGY